MSQRAITCSPVVASLGGFQRSFTQDRTVQRFRRIGPLGQRMRMRRHYEPDRGVIDTGSDHVSMYFRGEPVRDVAVA